jgi:tetratricopeptide (TPR) repeat protein
LQQLPGSATLARAESLLTVGRLQEARDLAEGLARARPDDPATLTVLGRIWLAWPTFGRYRAESLLTRAGALSPQSPEPYYYLSLVGLRLAGDDGEAIARDALVHVLTLAPDYRDAWAQWSGLYRGDEERAAMAVALAAHGGTFPADLWRAQLLVELRRYVEATPLLDSLCVSRARDPVPWALLARARFEQGEDVAGVRAYDAALARAADDTGQWLWHQVRSIASPLERTTWQSVTPGGRAAFLRVFWTLRNPDVRDSVNQRIGEHFRRLAEARRMFALLHPMSRWHHSRLWRTLQGGVGLSDSAELGDVRTAIGTARLPRVGDAPVAAGVAPRLDDSTRETVNLEDGLDDRGRILVRYGNPDQRYVWSNDAETWRYELPQGELQVTFVRRTSDGGGDQVVTPVVAGEAEAADYLLRTDRPGLASTLSFVFWPAEFRHGTGQMTDVVLFLDRVAATATLYDTDGRETSRDSATRRALHLAAPPGFYVLAIDAERTGELGRFRGSIPVTRFAADSLAVSSLLVAPGDTPASRPQLEAATPATLRLQRGQAVRVYAEIYGLADDAGVMRYDAVYRFARARTGPLRFLSRDHVTSVEFRRSLPADDPEIETLVVDPGRLPPGHYVLTLRVKDVVRGTQAASAMLEFDLR